MEVVVTDRAKGFIIASELSMLFWLGVALILIH